MSPQPFSDLKVGSLYRLLKKPYVLGSNDRGAIRHSLEPGMIFVPVELNLPGSAGVFDLARVKALIQSEVLEIMITSNDYELLEER